MEVKPEACTQYGTPLAGEDPDPGRHQLWHDRSKRSAAGGRERARIVWTLARPLSWSQKACSLPAMRMWAEVSRVVVLGVGAWWDQRVDALLILICNRDVVGSQVIL